MEIRIDDKTLTCENGSAICDILASAGYDLNEAYTDNPIIGAVAANTLASLSTKVDGDCEIVPVRAFSSLGKRIYRHSICFLLIAAVNRLAPHRKLIIGHSLGDGYYFTFDDRFLISTTEVNRIRECMQDMVRRNLPITTDNIPYRDALMVFRKNQQTQSTSLVETINPPFVKMSHIEDFSDLTVEPLVMNTGILQVWDLMKYGEKGLLLRYPRTKNPTAIQEFVDNPKLFAVFKEYKKWNSILKMQSVGQINQLDRTQLQDYIIMCETLQEKKIAAIADAIKEKTTTKFVFIAGPSSSGKTTFSYKLSLHLKTLGMNICKISLDNYYRPKSEIPLGDDGKPDLECLEALDTDLFQENLFDLYDGKAVHLPRYNFKKAATEYDDEPTVINDKTIIIIEGIHGLNPKLVPTMDRNISYKIYISALTQLNLDEHNRISTSDNRLLRRIVRDNQTRGTSALETLNMWDMVQEGEKKHIFPYQNEADVMLNSALNYELGVLAGFAQPLLRSVRPTDGEAYINAQRLLDFISTINIIPDSMVPTLSLLREFIGGNFFDVS